MPGFVIDGKLESASGLSVSSWHDDPALRLDFGEDCRRRFTRWVRAIVLHTTRGIPGGRDHRPQQILSGSGPGTDAGARIARSWSRESKQAGAHLVVDFDGSIACLADLRAEAAFHAGEVNEVSIGIEILQGRDAELYEGQLESVVRLVDWLTARFGIQRQMPAPEHESVIPRVASGGLDVVGIYGHRHVTTNRGPGDPGDAVFGHLRAAGYEVFDFSAGEDLAAWRERQHEVLELDARACDGVPGPGTVALLKERGRVHGLWVERPPFLL